MQMPSLNLGNSQIPSIKQDKIVYDFCHKSRVRHDFALKPSHGTTQYAGSMQRQKQDKPHHENSNR